MNAQTPLTERENVGEEVVSNEEEAQEEGLSHVCVVVSSPRRVPILDDITLHHCHRRLQRHHLACKSAIIMNCLLKALKA